MKKLIMVVAAAALYLGTVSVALAFNCALDQQAAEEAIARAAAAAKAMTDENKVGAVHALIDDAKMLLASSIFEHETAEGGAFDHARSVAKARAALGYAQAALILVHAKSL